MDLTINFFLQRIIFLGVAPHLNTFQAQLKMEMNFIHDIHNGLS